MRCNKDADDFEKTGLIDALCVLYKNRETVVARPASLRMRCPPMDGSLAWLGEKRRMNASNRLGQDLLQHQPCPCR